MPNEKTRLDESVSIDALRKSLTGRANVRPAFDRISVDADGQIEIRPAQGTPPADTNSGSGGGSGNSDKD
jgi:hypothetical protein